MIFKGMFRGALVAAMAVSGLGAGEASAQNWKLAGTFGDADLSAGFLPDPHSVELTAGGPIRLSQRVEGCNGYIADAPDYRIQYQAGTLPLFFNAESGFDTTIAVLAPDGRWHCDDDGAQVPLNPLVRIDTPRSGLYSVWVGTFSDSGGARATLHVSEVGEPGASGAQPAQPASGGSVDIFAAAVQGTYRLDHAFLPDPWQVAVTAGGPLGAGQAIRQGCFGNVTGAPSIELDYEGSSDLFIYTSGGADVTLAVNAPDGTWHCDDDSAASLNAGLSFTGGTDGVYDIYVGAFGSGTQSTTLNVSEIGLDR